MRMRRMSRMRFIRRLHFIRSATPWCCEHAAGPAFAVVPSAHVTVLA